MPGLSRQNRLFPAMRESGIYAIVGPDGRPYVGMTAGSFINRWIKHINDLEAGRHKRRDLQAVFDQSGLDSLVFQILEVITDLEQIESREEYWISECGGVDACYNAPSQKGAKRPWMSSPRKQPKAAARPFLLSLETDQATALQRLAQAEGNSIASLIRRAIAQFLAAQS